MPDYNLGTAEGKVKISYDGKGVEEAKKGFRELDKGAEGTSESMDRVATAAGGAGLGIAAGIGLAVKTSVDFEKQISAIGAVSGASAADLEAFRSKALQLGSDTSFGATEAAAAMEELAKAGLSTTQILNGAADATVALAAAGGIELAEAAELAADAMTSFGLAASDLPKVADTIAGAANASSIGVGEFGQSLKQVGAVANLAGVSFEDTATAIALLGANGIKGSDAGTSLKTMLSGLIPVTKQQVELFSDLGLVTAEGANAFFDAEGNLKSLAEVSGILANATKDMTSEQKQLTLETLFGSDAIRAAAILTKSGAEGFDAMAASMSKVTAEEVAAARLDNTAGAIEQLKGNAETAAIAIGTALLPALNSIILALTRAANWFNGLSESTQKTIINVALVTSAILILVATAIKIAQMAIAINTVVTAMKAWALWSKIVTVATKAWAAAQAVFNAVAALNPIGLIVIAVIALIAVIVLLWKKNETFRRIVMAAWEGIKDAASAVADWFMGTLVPWFQRIWASVSDGFMKAWEFIKRGFEIYVNFIKGYINVLVSVVKFLAPAFVATFKAIVAVVQAAWAVIQAIWALWVLFLRVTLVQPLKALWNAFVETFNAIKQELIDFWGWLSPYVMPIVNAVTEGVAAAWEWVKSATETVWNAIKSFFSAWWDGVVRLFTDAWNLITAGLSIAWDFISSLTITVWNGIKNFFVSFWEFIKATFRTAVNTVVTVMDGIRAIVDKVKNFFNQLRDAANGGTGTLLEFVKGIPGRVISALGNLGGLLYNKGRDLVQGFINGIRDMIGAAANAAKNLVGAVTDYLPGSPAKKGPLSGRGYVKLRAERFVDDFAGGVTQNVNAAVASAKMMIGNVAATLPVDNAGAVLAGAGAGFGGPVAGASTTTNNTRTLHVESIVLQGVWDFTDPVAARGIVATLHDELDRYEKEHK